MGMYYAYLRSICVATSQCRNDKVPRLTQINCDTPPAGCGTRVIYRVSTMEDKLLRIILDSLASLLVTVMIKSVTNRCVTLRINYCSCMKQRISIRFYQSYLRPNTVGKTVLAFYHAYFNTFMIGMNLRSNFIVLPLPPRSSLQTSFFIHSCIMYLTLNIALRFYTHI